MIRDYIKDILIIIAGCIYVPFTIIIDQFFYFIGKLSKKDKDVNISNMEYYSLAPSIQEEEIKLYKKRIDNILSEKIKYKGRYVAKNKNIAITGEYATGKSSLVRTYFKDNRHVIYVSIASYLENLSQNKNTEILEKGILQQILYEISPLSLPLSRISRRDSNNISFFVSNIVISVIVLFILSAIEKVFGFNLIATTKSLFSLSNILWFGICFFAVYKIRPKLKLNKISIDKIELSKDEEENNESLLNKYVDEIIHAFQFSRYNTVIFEDIDRVKDYRMVLFSRLKDINSLINKALGRHNKEVQFIYLLSDSIFPNPADKVKFFDSILDIVPFCNAYNSTDILKKIFGNKVSEDILKSVSLDLTDQRIIYDIANEFNMLLENYNAKLEMSVTNESNEVDQEDINQIFYLSVYKILYPSRYKKLQSATGPIVYYFSQDFISKINNKIWEENKEKWEKIKLLYDKLLSNELYDTKKLTECIKKSMKNATDSSSISSIKLSFGDGTISSFNQLPKEKLINSLSDKDTRVICEDKSYKMEDIFKNETLSLDDIVIASKILDNYSTKESLKKWLDGLKKNFQKNDLTNITIEYKINFLKEIYTLTDDEGNEQLNSFEEKMLRNNILKNNFSEFLSRATANLETHSVNDTILVRKIKENKELQFDVKIEDVKFVFNELSVYDFALNSVCIYDLFKHMTLKLNPENEYYNQFFNNLNVGKILFLISLHEESKVAGSKLRYYYDHIWKFLNMPKGFEILESKETKKLLYYTIMYGDPKLLESTSYFYRAIEETSNIDSYFEPNIDDVFKNCFSKFKNIKYSRSSFESRNHKYIELVYENEMYEDNLEFLENICDIEGIAYHNEKLIENIFAIKKVRKEMFEKYIHNIYNIFKKYENSKKYNDSYENIKNLYEENKDNLTPSELLYIINRETTIMDKIDWIPSSIYETLLRNNKINPNWENIYNVFVSNSNTFSEALEKYILENVDEIAKEKPKSNIFLGNLEKLFTLESLDDESFEKIVSSYEEVRHFSYIPKVYSDERLSILMKYNLIILNKEKEEQEYKDDIIAIVNNENIDYTSKEQFIELNQEVVMNIEGLIGNAENMLFYLRSNIKPIYKEKIVEKYYGTEIFSSIEVKREVFELVKSNTIKVTQSLIQNDLMMLNLPIIEKQELITNNYDTLEDIIEDILKLLSTSYKELIENRRGYISTGDEHFLIFLKSKGIIADYKTKRNSKKPTKYNVKMN